MKKNMKEYIMHTIAVLVVLAFFGDIYLLSRFEMPASNEKVLFMILGALATAFGTVINWYFGSSSGSKDKTELLNQKP